MKPERKPPQRLFIPGPTDVLPDVMQAQTAPMIGHRSDEFESLFAKVESQLRAMFETEHRVYIVASSGSGMLEAAIRNTVRQRVLCVVNGAFGQRWAQIASSCGKDVLVLESEWNQALQPAAVRDRLIEALSDGPVDAVTVTHNETSTGILNPAEEIAHLVKSINQDTLHPG